MTFYRIIENVLNVTSFSSVQFSRSVVSDFLQPHESQQARPPYPSPTPEVYSNLCPLSWWCHPAISSSIVPFSSCPQSLPASGSFPMSQLFAWGGQSYFLISRTPAITKQRERLTLPLSPRKLKEQRCNVTSLSLLFSSPSNIATQNPLTL